MAQMQMKVLNNLNVLQFATGSESPYNYQVVIVQERDQFQSNFSVISRANIVNIENTKEDRART